jgi:hypothetical protein
VKPLNELEIELFALYEQHLKAYDVKWPSAQRLATLLHLYGHFPNWIHKDDLTALVRVDYPGSGDLQEARHLTDLGWDILSSNTRFSRGRVDKTGPKDSYRLGGVEHANPVWLTKAKVKRLGCLAAQSWNELLIAFEERGCAVCGCKQKHYDKGHLDPTKPPELGNIVPMCVECNQFAQAHNHTFTLSGMVARGHLA